MLAEFLLARIAEDEAAAQEANDHDRWESGEDGNGDPSVFESDVTGQSWRVALVGSSAVAEHVARHDPARVLAECEAKRRIVAANAALTYEPYVLLCLALPYSDHSDYDEAWRP